jgi:Exonuclease
VPLALYSVMFQRVKPPIFVRTRYISKKAKHNWRQVLGAMEATSGYSPYKDNNALARANGALLARGAFPGKYASTSTLGAESSDNKRPLWFGDGPMVWIDCEVRAKVELTYQKYLIDSSRVFPCLQMTGLNPKKDRLLEIAVLITDGNLDVVDEEGISFTIRTDKEHLDNMDEWCVRQHGEVRHPLAYLKTSLSYS